MRSKPTYTLKPGWADFDGFVCYSLSASRYLCGFVAFSQTNCDLESWCHAEIINKLPLRNKLSTTQYSSQLGLWSLVGEFKELKAIALINSDKSFIYFSPTLQLDSR